MQCSEKAEKAKKKTTHTPPPSQKIHLHPLSPNFILGNVHYLPRKGHCQTHFERSQAELPSANSTYLRDQRLPQKPWQRQAQKAALRAAPVLSMKRLPQTVTFQQPGGGKGGSLSRGNPTSLIKGSRTGIAETLLLFSPASTSHLSNTPQWERIHSFSGQWDGNSTPPLLLGNGVMEKGEPEQYWEAETHP